MKTYHKAVIALVFIAVILYVWYSSHSEPGYYLNVQTTIIPDHTPTTGLLDLPNFLHLLTPRNVCQNTSIRYIQIVTSYAGEVTARSALRRAYPSEELQKLGIQRVFLLAKTKNALTDVTQHALQDENRRFGDLLQGNFMESYRNLTYKHAMGLKWSSAACPHADFIFKMDDDIVVDLYQIVQLLEPYKNPTFDFLGYVFDQVRPIRMKANKWYVTKGEYSRNYYPKFVSGWFYVTTPASAAKIVEQASHLRYFWIDDVFLTGVVAELIESKYVNIGHRFTTYPEYLDCCISHNVSCEFLVGPSGGDFDLQLRFQQHAKRCSAQLCQPSSPTFNISKVCVAKKVLPQLNRGLPSIKIIKL